MPIRANENLFPGINPHLNSYLQSEGGGWESFHAEHIIVIARMLDQLLPENYYAVAERSLQISEIGLSALSETLEDNMLAAVVIYEIVEDNMPGQAVTRLELLSPANKPPHAHNRQYAAKRLQTLHSGLNLVEIDYLHEQRPVLNVLPGYPDNEPGAFPYHIIVSDPRPTLEEGRAIVYGFGVADPLATITLPVAGDDTITLDMGAVYTRTYEGVRLYRIVVDYGQEPVNFDRYHPADREKIRQRMAEIAQDHAG